MIVAGIGAIGTWAACALRADVHARPATAQAIAAHGLRVEGLTTCHHAPSVLTEPAGTHEIIVLTVKAHQTAALAEVWAPHLAEGGAMVSLQNGFGNSQAVAAAVGPERTAIGLTSNGVTVLGPAHVRHAGHGPTRIGAMPGAPEASARKAEAALAPLGAQWEPNIVGAVWMKALVNHGLNPVAALATCTNGEVLADPEKRQRALRLVDEGVSLSRAAGIQLPGDPREALLTTLEKTAANHCSMVQDVLAGRATEIDSITGFLVRLARRLGYPLFESEEIYHEVKDLEETYVDDAWAITRDAAAREERWAPW